MTKMRLYFPHPTTSESYEAMVAPECTAQLALQRLQAQETGPFLRPAPAERPYQLVVARTQTIMPPGVTMREAGVVENDVLNVVQKHQGA